MRHLLNQAAQSAVKVKGSIFELTFSRLLPRLGYQQAIWAIAHRLCRVLWVILHAGVRYEERGPAVSAKSKRTRAARMVRELKKLGYRVEGGTTPCGHSGMNGWGFSNLSSPHLRRSTDAWEKWIVATWLTHCNRVQDSPSCGFLQRFCEPVIAPRSAGAVLCDYLSQGCFSLRGQLGDHRKPAETFAQTQLAQDELQRADIPAGQKTGDLIQLR